jgi:ribosomal protein S18 acetylase RimI-like enzyme
MGEAREIEIRTAIAADADAVTEVYLASRKRLLHIAPLAHSDQDVRRWIGEVLIPRGGVHVAAAGGVLVGMMALSQDGSYGWIDQLYLHPEAVGQGIGSRLLELAKTQLRPPIRLYTFQANLGARRFYERYGFRAIEFTDGMGNEEKCPDVLYEWRPEH